MLMEIAALQCDKTVQKRDDQQKETIGSDDFCEKLLAARAAYKRKARKRAYDQVSDKYQQKRREEAAMIQELETLRLRKIKAVNFANVREGTKKGPMM